jgi:hypothetical protein
MWPRVVPALVNVTVPHAKELYAAGWPKDVRPYQARHGVALELGEAGSTWAMCRAG